MVRLDSGIECHVEIQEADIEGTSEGHVWTRIRIVGSAYQRGGSWSIANYTRESRLSIADGVETSETRKDAEQSLELAMYMSCDQRLKNALEGKNYREAHAELSRRLDRDADVDHVAKLTSFAWKKGDDMDFETGLGQI